MIKRFLKKLFYLIGLSPYSYVRCAKCEKFFYVDLDKAFKISISDIPFEQRGCFFETIDREIKRRWRGLGKLRDSYM